MKITCVVGTRPEAIKMAPLIMALKDDERFKVTILSTGQHSDMLKQALGHFGLKADVSLDVMKERQSLEYLTSAVLQGVGSFLSAHPQDMLLVHGDTTTTFGAALAGFYNKTQVGHVEAGLRSYDMKSPFPEEANRVITDKLSSLLFAPTQWAAENLIEEGADRARVFVTGNTVIDALFWTLKSASLPDVLKDIPEKSPLILMTAHRRESWGEPLVRICRAIMELLSRNSEVRILIPMHKNPAVRETICKELRDNPRVILTEPMDYPDFIAAMNRSLFILSDSGGIQEEASALKKPVLILRELSERPEAISVGTGLLVGTNHGSILEESTRILNDEEYRQSFSNRGMPFGDGQASLKIKDILVNYIDKN